MYTNRKHYSRRAEKKRKLALSASNLEAPGGIAKAVKVVNMVLMSVLYSWKSRIKKKVRVVKRVGC